MARLRNPADEFQDLSNNSVVTVSRAVEALILARARAQVGQGDPQKTQAARSRLADVLRQSQALADLMGRRRALLELDAAKSRAAKRSAVQHSNVIRYEQTPVVPRVPFQQAIEDLVSREPRLAASAELVAEVYTRDHGFALAQSADVAITERIQKAIARALRLGQPEPKATEIVRRLGDFTKAYAKTAYRTNLNTAFTAGRFQQAADPEVAPVMPAFEYMAIQDADVRRGRIEDQGENHLALHGFIAPTNSRTWNTYAPPNGYQCRCTLRLVSVFELMRRGIIDEPGQSVQEQSVPSGAAVHPDFSRSRPDLQLYFGIRNR
jgi:SPP1 gp7 family putative phage head morphogenesis protein